MSNQQDKNIQPTAIYYIYPPNNKVAGTTRKYGAYQNFSQIKKEGTEHYKKSPPLTSKEVKLLLNNYKEETIQNIPLNTHVRYFSAERRDKNIVVEETTRKPLVTFKRGGFLKKKVLDKKGGGYVILSNKPPTFDKSIDHGPCPTLNWSVSVDQYTTFYRILHKNEHKAKKVASTTSSTIESKTKTDEIISISLKKKRF